MLLKNFCVTWDVKKAKQKKQFWRKLHSVSENVSSFVLVSVSALVVVVVVAVKVIVVIVIIVIFVVCLNKDMFF